MEIKGSLHVLRMAYKFQKENRKHIRILYP